MGTHVLGTRFVRRNNFPELIGRTNEGLIGTPMEDE